MATHGRSGAASLAPNTPAAPKPMPEKPQELSMRLGPARLPELHEPVVVDAYVAGEDGLRGQHRLAVGDHPLGPDRRGVDVEVGSRELLPRRRPVLDLGMPGLERIAALAAALAPARPAAGAGRCARRPGCRGRADSCGRARRSQRRRGSAWRAGNSRNSRGSMTRPSGRRSGRRWPAPRRRVDRPHWPDRRRCGR